MRDCWWIQRESVVSMKAFFSVNSEMFSFDFLKPFTITRFELLKTLSRRKDNPLFCLSTTRERLATGMFYTPSPPSLYNPPFLLYTWTPYCRFVTHTGVGAGKVHHLLFTNLGCCVNTVWFVCWRFTHAHCLRMCAVRLFLFRLAHCTHSLLLKVCHSFYVLARMCVTQAADKQLVIAVAFHSTLRLWLCWRKVLLYCL